MNNEFLQAVFGLSAPFAHITDFAYDPDKIPAGRHLMAWKGDYASKYAVGQDTNQYFTISTFHPDDQGVARRRKALFKATHCIVLDDVKEKLSMDQVGKLPPPSWILETSKGSEQWGYILDVPCTDRARVENLLDGLVANGLAPEGRDPGMKGVTRYVRLPDGINNKAKRYVDGIPFKCRMVEWNPWNKVSIEAIATPFLVNLDAARRESRTDGAAAVGDHPLLQIPDLVHIKEVRSDGRFDITCPWVNEHTGADDSGSAVFTNQDGTFGFKCHHGTCQERTGRHLIEHLERELPGFRSMLKDWQVTRELAKVVPFSFFKIPGMVTSAPTMTEDAPITLNGLFHKMQDVTVDDRQKYHFASKLLQLVDDMPKMERLAWHDKICHQMHWKKIDFKEIIKELREGWYLNTKNSDFYNNTVFVKELNQFYMTDTRIFFTAEAFQNSFCHEDPEARKSALQDGLVTKVDRLDFAPLSPRFFDVKGIRYCNTWCNKHVVDGVPGDVERWLGHWTALGWASHRKHMMQWMAYTLIHPDVKINHALLLGSGEGCGKDFLLYPLIKAMGDSAYVISGDELLEGFNDYILNTKLLVINETDLGNRAEALAVSNKLKPLAAAPPDTLRMNQKHLKQQRVRNILNAVMTTNSQLPIKINGVSRRYYAVWSDLQTRDELQDVMPEWNRYWDDRWDWMRNDGADACIYYLRNCVDISDFNPSAAPPMTEFLREIHESSKSFAQQTVESFIARKLGNFKKDLTTLDELLKTIRAGMYFSEESMMVDGKTFTAHKLCTILRDIPGCIRVRARRAHYEMSVWVIRNAYQYPMDSPSRMFTLYEEQRKSNNNVIEIVK